MSSICFLLNLNSEDPISSFLFHSAFVCAQNKIMVLVWHGSEIPGLPYELYDQRREKLIQRFLVLKKKVQLSLKDFVDVQRFLFQLSSYVILSFTVHACFLASDVFIIKFAATNPKLRQIESERKIWNLDKFVKINYSWINCFACYIVFLQNWNMDLYENFHQRFWILDYDWNVQYWEVNFRWAFAVKSFKSRQDSQLYSRYTIQVFYKPATCSSPKSCIPTKTSNSSRRENPCSPNFISSQTSTYIR